MKVIQDALLYNKIECYNKGVQRSPSLSVMLAQRPITLVLMMINSCSYSTNDLVFN